MLSLVLIAGIGNQAFADDMTTGSTPGTPGTPSQILSPQNNACVFLDFEGVGDILPVGIIGDTTWSAGAIGLVDSDAGGSGNIANEPSPDTIVFISPSGIFDVTFTNPVGQVSWFYMANVDTPARIYDVNDDLITTVNQPALQQGVTGGDPTGTFDNWSSVSHSETSNIIKRVEFERIQNHGIDNFEFCTGLVGGELLQIDSTALILAGAQTFSWMIPLVLSGIGIGLFVVSRKNE